MKIFEGHARKRFWFGLCLLLATGIGHAANTVTYVYTDPQGTPLAEADVNGNITATYNYTPYGTMAPNMSAPPNGPGYTGHVNDPDTGFVYMQARYYDPATGRFLSVDPVAPVAGNASNFSRYTYAANNPVRNTDPTGMFPGDENDNDNSAFPYTESFVNGSSGGGGGSQAQSTTQSNSIPSGTPPSMVKYFTSTSTSDRINAALAVGNYFGINSTGVDFFYSPFTSARAAIVKDGPNGDAQLTLGPSLFQVSFGMIGAVLSHEIEGHYQLQLSQPGMPASDQQSSYMREVQAYKTELSPQNIQRFGLTPSEVNSESIMMNRYYLNLSPPNQKLINQGIYKPF